MAQPLQRKTVWTRQADVKRRVRHEERKPNLPGPYIYVGDWVGPDDPGNDPPVTTWQSVPWKNSFTWVGSSYVGFRHGLDGDVEFIGVYDLTQGAVTGTVAFTLPVPWRGQTFDFHFPIYVGGTDWQTGVNSVDGITGDVTVYWPTI